MKIYKLLIAGMLLSGIISCTKDLVYVDYSEINPSIFPSNAADVDAMVISCYYPIRSAWSDGINSQSEKGLLWIDNTTEILSGKYGSQQTLTLHNYKPTDVEGVTYYYDNWYRRLDHPIF
jgi:starch-binding outer membrane protein, SusD/RagB family